MPLGALCEGASGRTVSLRAQYYGQHTVLESNMKHCCACTYPCLSSSLRLKFIDIIRHERFSRRSEFGSWPLVLWYSFHICVPSGSFFCISSGVSSSDRAATDETESSLKWSKKVSRNKPLRASRSVGDRSSLVDSVSRVDCDVSEAMALDVPDPLLVVFAAVAACWWWIEC